MNKIKNKFLSFTLLASFLLSMINPTNYGLTTVYAASSYTVKYEDFTDDGNGVLTNFSGDIGSASVVEFPASLTYNTTDDKGTPDDTNDDETLEHTITPTYSNGIFNADSFAQKTFKFADGVKIGVKMQDAVATRIEFAGNVTLIGVTPEEYFKNNHNIETVTGCDFLFTTESSSAYQFVNSSVKNVSFTLHKDQVHAYDTFEGCNLETLQISKDQYYGTLSNICSMFKGATITKDCLAAVLDHIYTSGYSIDIQQLLDGATVSGFASQAEVITYVSNKISEVNNLKYAFELTSPKIGTTLDLSSFTLTNPNLYDISDTFNYQKLILPAYNSSVLEPQVNVIGKAYFTQAGSKELILVDGTTGSVTQKTYGTAIVYKDPATVIIHGTTNTTKYLSDVYTFAEVLGTDAKYTATEGGTKEFDLTQKPELNHTYDLYPLNTDKYTILVYNVDKNKDLVEKTYKTDGNSTIYDVIKTDYPNTSYGIYTYYFISGGAANKLLYTTTKPTSTETRIWVELLGDKPVTPDTPEDVDMDLGENTVGTEITFEDGTTGTIGSGDTISLTATETTSAPDMTKKYISFKNVQIFNITVSNGTKNITEFKKDVEIEMPIPDDYVSGDIKVLDFHEGIDKTPIEINSTVDTAAGKFKFKTKTFSTYAFLYNDSTGTTTNWNANIVFDDDNDSASARPTSLILHIYVNNVEYKTENLTITGATNTVTVTVPQTVADETAEVSFDLDGAGNASIAKYSGPVKSTVGGVPTYTYTYGGTVAQLPIKINFAGDSSDTSTRPDTVKVTTVATYTDDSANTYTTDVNISKTASRTTVNLTYDTENEGKALSTLITTFPGVTDYIISAESTTGTTEHTVTYTYNPDAGQTAYTLTAMFKNDSSSTSARPDNVTATTTITYDDGNTTVVETEIPVSKTTSTVSKSFDYDNEYITGASVTGVKTEWSDITDYSKSEDAGTLSSSKATYTYTPKATMTVGVSFVDADNTYKSRPTTVAVPVTITYADSSTKTYNATITLASGLTTTVEYDAVNNAGSVAKSAAAVWPQLSGYNSATAGDATLTSQTASYSLMYYTEVHTITFTGDSSDTSYRPESITVDVTGNYADGSVYENEVDVSITKASTQVSLTIPTYYNGSTYDSITYSFPDITNYKLTESGKKHTYAFDSSTDSKKITYTIKFSDSNNTAGLRPSKLKVTFANVNDSTDTFTSELSINDPTTATTESYTGTATKNKNNATYKISKVEKADGASGSFDKYTVSISDLTATLSHTPETTSVSLSATWTDDGENADNTRPSNLSVTVKNGDTTVSTVTLNSDNSWKKDVTVNKYLKGVEAKYTYSFPDVSNYSKSVSETTATYKFTGTLSKAAAEKEAAAKAAANGTTTGTDAADNTYNIDMFDWIDYANRYPDLKAAFGYNKEQLYAHYIHFGIAEGRVATWTGKYANVNEDILKAYFPNDYKYKTDLSSSSDKYSEITGDSSSSSSSSSSGGTTEKATENTTITRNDDGTTTVKTVNGKTVTETTYDEDGNVIGTKTYATGDTNRNSLNITILLIMLVAAIVIGFSGYDIYADEKKRKLLWSRVDK